MSLPRLYSPTWLFWGLLYWPTARSVIIGARVDEEGGLDDDLDVHGSEDQDASSYDVRHASASCSSSKAAQKSARVNAAKARLEKAQKRLADLEATKVHSGGGLMQREALQSNIGLAPAELDDEKALSTPTAAVQAAATKMSDSGTLPGAWTVDLDAVGASSHFADEQAAVAEAIRLREQVAKDQKAVEVAAKARQAAEEEVAATEAKPKTEDGGQTADLLAKLATLQQREAEYKAELQTSAQSKADM
jgi:hypothetical protein